MSRHRFLVWCALVLCGLCGGVRPVLGEPPPVVYEGAYEEVGFPAGQRVAVPMKLELRVAGQGGMNRKRPQGNGVLRVWKATDGAHVQDYPVTCAYNADGAAIYLATAGATALTLYLSPLPSGAAGDYPLTGHLLSSKGEAARAVHGTYHLRRALPHH